MELLYEREYGLNELPEVVGQLSPIIKRNPHLAISGDMGAGKTTFIASLCETLGLDGSIDSPTFGLVNTYKRGEIELHHFDWYRLRTADELQSIGWEEYVSSGAFIAVEWPERVPEALDESFLLLKLTLTDSENRRKIQVFGTE